tara:strand:+ start:1172 stop:1951 length:780 start_codon:yes stop_codon:yes gene_type:complete
MDNDDLVDIVRERKSYGKEIDRRVLRAMRRVDRKKFLSDGVMIANPHHHEYFMRMLTYDQPELVLEELQKLPKEPRQMSSAEFAYFDVPLTVGYKQTCSQPSIVAFMTDALELDLGMQVREVGTGCGYHAAVVAEVLGKNGHVSSVEIVPEMSEIARRNLRTHFRGSVDRRVSVVSADGSVPLPNDNVRYDRIYLTAGVSRSFNPNILGGMLKTDGILLFPQKVGGLWRVVYDGHGNAKRSENIFPNVSFVPLIGAGVN